MSISLLQKVTHQNISWSTSKKILHNFRLCRLTNMHALVYVRLNKLYSHSKLLGFWTLSIVRYSKNYRTRRFGN
jgi:endonuclease III-like uncharacterized protein